MHSTLKINGRPIRVEHPDGTELAIDNGVLSVETPSSRSLEAQFNEAIGPEGIQWGDAIAWATKKLGIQQCAPCKARQKVLNQLKQLGVKETIRQIKETF